MSLKETMDLPENSQKMISSKNKMVKILSKEQLKNMNREELEEQVIQLSAHNTQLQALLRRTLTGGADSKEGAGSYVKKRKQRPFDFSKYSTRHVLLKIAYLGWDYQGYAVQEDTHNTIEAVLFDALLKTKLIQDRQTSNYHRCGRTDKGVSAFSQVVSLTLRSVPAGPDGKQESLQYVDTINRVLPEEVRVLAWCPVPEGFSARFDCCSRTYKYFFPAGGLDIQRMREAGKMLEGCHDFRNLCKMDVGNGVVNFRRSIDSFSVTLLDEECRGTGCEGDVSKASDASLPTSGYTVCVATIKGKAFLWHQVRAVMAVLLLIGEGHEAPSVITELLDIKKNPCKPQYSLANEVPLCLFASEFPSDTVQWRYSEGALERVHGDMQRMWSLFTVRSSIIRRMLSEVSSTLQQQPQPRQHLYLGPGARPRVYKPLLERHTCDSLESKVKHYVKRKRLDPDVLSAVQADSGAATATCETVPMDSDVPPHIKGDNA